MLPGSVIHHRLRYRYHGKDCELDGLVILDNQVLMIEAKAKKLTLAAKQGDKARLAGDVRSAIEDAFQQGKRAREYIMSSEEPVEFTDSEGCCIRIDKSLIRDYYLVSVLSTQFPYLATNLSKLKPLGLFASDEYPWAVSLDDLRIIAEQIEFPSELFHYIQRRIALQFDPRFEFFDELDVFGIYQQQGLDLDQPQFEGYTHVTLHGYCEGIDEYFLARETEMEGSVPKPKIDLPPKMVSIIRAVEDTGVSYRFDFTLTLLDLPRACQEQLVEMIGDIDSKAKTDGQQHSLSLVSPDGTFGAAYIADRKCDPEELSKKLNTFVIAKKYQTRLSKWIGFAHDVARDNTVIETIAYAEGEWVEDRSIETLLPRLLRPGTDLLHPDAQCT